MPLPIDLSGRRIAVAGAGGLLGPHAVRALTEAGAVVLAGDVREEALEPVRDVAAEAHACDLSTDEGAAAWAAACGEVDGLLHLVGGWRGGPPIEETSREDLDFLDTVLRKTLVHATRAFAPALKASGRGRFATVSSSAVQAPGAGNAAYAAAKAGAEAWTLAFGRELAEHGGTANVLVVKALTDDPGHGSFTHVADVAAGLAWLCSDAAARMNAQRLPLHG